MWPKPAANLAERGPAIIRRRLLAIAIAMMLGGFGVMAKMVRFEI